MDDTVLDLSLWEGGVDGRIKSLQIVCAGNENILYAPIFQTIEHRCPELGALIFANPHPQDVFPAIQVDSNGNVSSPNYLGESFRS